MRLGEGRMAGEHWFDALTRTLGRTGSRKQFLRLAAAGVAAAFVPRPAPAAAECSPPLLRCGSGALERCFDPTKSSCCTPTSDICAKGTTCCLSRDRRIANCCRPGDRCDGDARCLRGAPRCRGISAACSQPTDCCAPLSCIRGTCQRCARKGSPCSAGSNPCCSGLLCLPRDGRTGPDVCRDCLRFGAECPAGQGCCDRGGERLFCRHDEVRDGTGRVVREVRRCSCEEWNLRGGTPPGRWTVAAEEVEDARFTPAILDIKHQIKSQSGNDPFLADLRTSALEIEDLVGQLNQRADTLTWSAPGVRIGTSSVDVTFSGKFNANGNAVIGRLNVSHAGRGGRVLINARAVMLGKATCRP